MARYAAGLEDWQAQMTWQKYEVTLDQRGNVAPSKDNRLVISTTRAGTFWHRHGTVWFSQVSLFPPTFQEPRERQSSRPHAIARRHAPGIPAFPRRQLRGRQYHRRPVSTGRKPSATFRNGPAIGRAWGYWSTDGLGLLEFLEWCEDLNMEPVLAVFAGYSLHQQHVTPGPDLEPYVQDALDEIEYVTGDTQHQLGRATRQGRSSGAVPAALTSKSATKTGSTVPAATTAASRSSSTPSRRNIPACRSSPPPRSRTASRI